MIKRSLNTQKYWENRLSSNLNLIGTGHRAFNLQYNKYLYQAQADCLSALLDKWKINLNNKRILDVGSGTGYYIDFYSKRNATEIIGIDISTSSIEYLKANFSKSVFFVEDISGPSLDHLGSFDFVSVISVIYHVIDNSLFVQALNNLCSLCKVGGYLLISDAFSGSWNLSARHAHLRKLEEYKPYIKDFVILDITPIYYLLNRTFIPVIGPKLIESLDLGKYFYRVDNQLREKGWNNRSGMKFMLVQKIQ